MDILITGVVCFVVGLFIGREWSFRKRVMLVVSDYQFRLKEADHTFRSKNFALADKIRVLEYHLARLGFYVDFKTNKLHRKKK